MSSSSILKIAIAIVLVMGLVAFLFRMNSAPDPIDPVSVEPTVRMPSAINVPSESVPSAPTTLAFRMLPPNESGIEFSYYGSPSDQHYITEQNGGGIALFDLDGDDQLDLFFVNGSHFQHSAEAHGATNRLFRGRGELKFADVSRVAGLDASGFGAGCGAADFNNDGFSDLFVACYGQNRFWRNNGDGTYSEITEEAGVGHAGFASSAAFADLDGDGNLDLFVVNYLDWVPDQIARDRIQSPMDFAGQPDLLYRNDGMGSFVEVGIEAGIAIAGDGKGLAVAIADLNGDRKLDVYVANDTRRNFLFQNRGDLQFDEVGVQTGSAVSQDGSIGSSMGIAISDYNLDHRHDLLITNFAQESVDVLMNVGDAGFLATNTELGVDVVSRPVLNFGIVCTDFDLDFWPDLFFANGHLWDETAAGGEYRMLPSLMQNQKGLRFIDASSAAGNYFQKRWLGRAAAMGDLDNDGDVDLMVSHLLDAPAVLTNESTMQGRSQRFMFVGTTSSRQPLGCEVSIQLNGGQKLVMQVPSGGSFQASHDPVVVVPTGKEGTVTEISICWSDGPVERWTELPNAETIKLLQGTGHHDSDVR